ncbi:hypothetical protein D3C73_985610 [compost metagenome]
MPSPPFTITLNLFQGLPNKYGYTIKINSPIIDFFIILIVIYYIYIANTVGHVFNFSQNATNKKSNCFSRIEVRLSGTEKARECKLG